MRLPLTSAHGPIGVAVYWRSINAMQLKRVNGVWHTLAAVMLKRNECGAELGQGDVDRLARILDRQGFRGRDVILATPQPHLMTAVLDLPPRDSGAPIEEITRGELAAMHRCNADSMEYDSWDLPELARGSDGTRVMAVGCQHEHANPLLDIFEHARLRVKALDTRACALARAIAPLHEANDRLTGVLSLDWNDSTLLMIAGDTVVFERVLIDCGLRQLHDTIVSEVDIDGDVASYLLTDAGLAEASEDASQRVLLAAVREHIGAHIAHICSELRLSLTYITQEYGADSVQQLLMVGEAAAVPDLAEGVGAGCGLHAAPVHPGQLTNGGSIRECESPMLMEAFGLAQHSGSK